MTIERILAEGRDAVRRGALVLDKVVPGWAERIKLEKLDMMDINLCVLGQLFGYDVETSIAKEMYPKLWNDPAYEVGSGYGKGRKIIPRILGIETDSIATSHDVELIALNNACGGVNNRCLWAEEVAMRLAGESDGETA